MLPRRLTWTRVIANGRLFKLSLLFSVVLSWGLEHGYHPDETVSMRGVVQLDLPAGEFTAPAAYFEGTFNYYL